MDQKYIPSNLAYRLGAFVVGAGEGVSTTLGEGGGDEGGDGGGEAFGAGFGAGFGVETGPG